VKHHSNGRPSMNSRLLRAGEVEARTGRSRSSIWRDERAGRFPRRIQIGENAVGWHEHEIAEWLATRPRGSEPARAVRRRARAS
jgi:prophage regulatory protein